MRRILTAREQFAMLTPWLEAGRDSDLMDYRTERHRQEQELEGLTGGHPADIEDYFARGGKPLITYTDWLNGRKGWGGEKTPIDSNYVHAPEPGSDYEPPW
jgi:hypothetical protein